MKYISSSTINLTRVFHYLEHTAKTILEYFEFKTVFSLLVIMGSFLFSNIETNSLIALFILIMVDFATAIAAAYKLNHHIQSGKVFRTAVKIAVYYTLIASGSVSEYAIPIIPLAQGITGFLVATELVSIIENVGNMGYAIPQKILNQIKRFRDGQ